MRAGQRTSTAVYVRDKAGIAKSGTNKKGEPIFVTGLRHSDFPFRIGKEWEQTLDLRLNNGTMRPYFNRWKVEAFEQVTVKAGTFEAFRISYYQESRSAGPTWRNNATLWWSPRVKAFIKRVVHSGDWGNDWELESFTIK